MTNKQLAAYLRSIKAQLEQGIGFAQSELADFVSDLSLEDSPPENLLPRHTIERYIGNAMLPVFDRNPDNYEKLPGRFCLLDYLYKLQEELTESIENLEAPEPVVNNSTEVVK